MLDRVRQLVEAISKQEVGHIRRTYYEHLERKCQGTEKRYLAHLTWEQKPEETRSKVYFLRERKNTEGQGKPIITMAEEIRTFLASQEGLCSMELVFSRGEVQRYKQVASKG